MKKLLAVGCIVLGLAACNDTGDREHHMETIDDQGTDRTMSMDSTTGTNMGDAYRDDTGASGLTTDTAVINKNRDSGRRQ